MELATSHLGSEGSVLSHRVSLPRLNQAASSQAGHAPPPSKKQKKESIDSIVQPLESLDPLEPFLPPLPVILETEHAARRKATAAAWAELLPKLVYPLMVWMLYRGEGQSKDSALCSCAKREKDVRVVSFTSAFCHSVSPLSNKIAFSNH